MASCGWRPVNGQFGRLWGDNMIEKREIKITKHARERLEERVVKPMIRGVHQDYLSNPDNLEKALYSAVNSNRESLQVVESKICQKGGFFYDLKFRSYDGVIPLRGLIRDSVLVTIWPLGGWRRVVV